MSLWRLLLLGVVLSQTPLANAATPDPLEQLSRFLHSEHILELFRGSADASRGLAPDPSVARLLLGYGTRLLYEGKSLEEQSGQARNSQWFSLRMQLLGHVAIAAAHARTDDQLEEAVRHLTEADRLVNKMGEFEPNKGVPDEERAIYAIRINRLVCIPLALTAQRLARNEKGEERMERLAQAEAYYGIVARNAPHLLDQF